MADTTGAPVAVQDVAKVEPSGRAIDQVRAHYHAQDRQVIVVDEWGLDIYAAPMTLEDSTRALKIRGDDPKRWYPAVIVQMARNANGERLFSFTEVDALVTEADSAVVLRVGMQITGDKVTPEDHKGNS